LEMRDLFRALRYFRPDAGRVVFVVCLLLVSVGLNALKPWPLALIVDTVLQNKPLPHVLARFDGWSKPALLAALSGITFLLYLFQGALAAGQNYLSIGVGLNGLTRARQEIFAWLQRLSWRFHQGARAGDLIYRASWDTYAIQTLFQQGLMTCVNALLSLTVMVAIMITMNVRLTLVALALAPLLVLGLKFFGAKMRHCATLAQQADSRVTSLIQQSIAALPLTQSYTREDFEAERFSGEAKRAQIQRLSQHGWELVYGFVIASIFGLGATAIIWLGAGQVAAGRLTVGELLVFLAYLTQLYEPLNQLSQVGATIAGATAGARRVFEILDTPEEVPERAGARPLSTRSSGAISFEGVCFAYEKDREVLREVSFILKSGESAGLIGPSGAGKTTLLHLLPRFFDPSRGVIKLDGVDLRELRLKDLRSQVALVLQEAVILPATVAENIGYGKPGASRPQIEAAARAAHADLFIQKLPQHYDTLIGEGATRLSVGERQRIHLARAFLKDAPVLLLDEPTSALDAESEALIAQSLRELLRGRTTLMVAHRLSTLAALSRVLTLKDGCLSE